jgi:hypothetical protein
MTARAAALCIGCVLIAGCYGLGPKTIPQPVENRETGVKFLIGREAEARGYGLYSYLLFGSPPTDATRARYVATVAACLENVPPADDMEAYLPRRRLNLLYLMVDDPVPFRLSAVRPGTPALQNAVEWVLAHYNYARARTVLSALPGQYRDGPYIVSHPEPLTGHTLLTGEYLVQNLSHTNPGLVGEWVDTFLVEASRPDYPHWAVLRRFMDELRNTIRVVTNEWPDIRVAVASGSG